VLRGFAEWNHSISLKIRTCDCSMNNFAFSRPLARILWFSSHNLKTRRYSTTTTHPPLAFAFDIVRTRLLRKEQSINSECRRRMAFLSEERMRFLLRDVPSKYWKGITISGSGCYNHFLQSKADFLQKNPLHPCA
jgi:hypothetical protein